MIVIDTSVALQWLLPEEGTALAESLIGQDLAAPDAIFLEAANVLGKKVRAKEMSVEQAVDGLDLIAENIDRLRPSRRLLAQALRSSAELSHRVYDCVFLACALNLNAHIATRDRRFRERASARGYGAIFLDGPP